jgi:DNA-binding response OmpR family regulator
MNHNVLIIEDAENVSKALEVPLHARDYQTSTAIDAIIGTQKAMGTNPDNLLIAMTMPGDNGLALADRLKVSTKTQDVPIIFLTANNQPELHRKTMIPGGTAFFETPYDFNYLLAAIRASIEHPHVCLSRLPIHHYTLWNIPA